MTLKDSEERSGKVWVGGSSTIHFVIRVPTQRSVHILCLQTEYIVHERTDKDITGIRIY